MHQFSHTKIKTTNNNKTENALMITHFPYKNKNKGFLKFQCVYNYISIYNCTKMDTKNSNNLFQLNEEQDQHSNLTLVIDGNWLLMSRLSVMSRDYAGDTATMMKKLKQLLCRSINALLRQFSDIDNIIFVADGGSWRDKIEQPDCIKKYHADYKGQRVKSEDIDWAVVFDEYADFINRIEKESNVTVTRQPSVEGDDWCWWWSNMLNNNNTNCIIWSADRDLTQLVKTDINTSTFTVTLYTRGKNTVLTEQAEEIRRGDYDIAKIFGNPYWQRNVNFLKAIESKCGEIRRINPERVVLDKIFRGDVSDNIFPSIKRVSKTGKEFRISEKMLYDFAGDVRNDKDISYYINHIYNMKQFKNKTAYTETDAFQHTVYNRRLVMMDEKYYPSSIIEKMKKYGSFYNKTKDISVTEQRLLADTVNGQNENMEDFLNNI